MSALFECARSPEISQRFPLRNSFSNSHPHPKRVLPKWLPHPKRGSGRGAHDPPKTLAACLQPERHTGAPPQGHTPSRPGLDLFL